MKRAKQLPTKAEGPIGKKTHRPGIGMKFSREEWAALARGSKQGGRSKVGHIRWLILAFDKRNVFAG